MKAKSLHSMITCATEHEMWNKLCQIYEQKSVTNKLALIQRFHDYQMNSADSVVEHVSKVQNMA